jgi:alkylation response protein AidB-like acyl-CoA dehydrogenase
MTIRDIAAELADEFRETAAEFDRTGEFPKANYDRMRETGYLRGPVPEELGGLGAALAETAAAQRALARGCASTALAVNMHIFQVGAAADGFRSGGPTGALLERIAKEGIVFGSTGAEAIVAGEWTTPTVAKADGDDGWIIDGRKYFCSQAPGMDLVRVNATDADNGDLLIFAVPAGLPGVKVVETWDTTGMRATASHDLVLEHVRVPAAALGARIPAGEPLRNPAIANVGRWFLTCVAGVYLGIAEEARALMYASLGSGGNSRFRNQVLTDVMIGELEAAFLTASSVHDQVRTELDSPPEDPQRGLALAVLCKQVVTEHAIAVVDKAVEVSGGSAYFRRSPLERLARDVRAARFHPPAAPVSFQIAGSRLAPSI